VSLTEEKLNKKGENKSESVLGTNNEVVKSLFPKRELPYIPSLLSIPTLPKEYNSLEDLYTLQPKPLLRRYFYSIYRAEAKNTGRISLVKVYNKKRVSRSPDFLENIKKEIMLHSVLGGNSTGVIDVTQQLSEDINEINFADDSKSTNEQRTLGSRSLLSLQAVWEFKENIYLFYEDGDFICDFPAINRTSTNSSMLSSATKSRDVSPNTSQIGGAESKPTW
jgi:hypothetical protein